MNSNYNLNFLTIRSHFFLKNKTSFNIYINSIFDDLADEMKGISFPKFNEIFKLPLLIAQKIFELITKKTEKFVCKKDFIVHLSELYFGTFEEVAAFIFNLYDFNSDGLIIPEDVMLILSFLPIREDLENSYEIQKLNRKEIEIYTNEAFGEKKTMDFTSFLEIIKITSDFFLQLVCFLYKKFPFKEDSMLVAFASNSSVDQSVNSSSGYENYSNSSTKNFQSADVYFAPPKLKFVKPVWEYLEDCYIKRNAKLSNLEMDIENVLIGLSDHEVLQDQVRNIFKNEKYKFFQEEFPDMTVNRDFKSSHLFLSKEINEGRDALNLDIFPKLLKSVIFTNV